jgi:hypothetical protein
MTMSKKIDLKKRFSALLGTTMLATALTTAPVSFNFVDLTLDDGAAYAKGGNSGSGSDDSDDDNSGSGSSNSGSGSDDDDSDDNSGSGSSNSGSGSDDDDDDDDDDHGRRGGRHGGLDDRGSSSTSIPAKFGFVVKAEVEGNHIEIGYSDGWKEEVEDGRYELKNPANRTVVQRPATQDDINRLNATARASRL